jgi:hypothetical protein
MEPVELETRGRKNQGGPVVRFLRRPIGRVVMLLLIAGALFLLWQQDEPPPTISVTNAMDEPIVNVQLFLSDRAGRPHSERLAELGPGARWEHTAASPQVRVDMLLFHILGESTRLEDLGELTSGQTMSLIIRGPDTVSRTVLQAQN